MKSVTIRSQLVTKCLNLLTYGRAMLISYFRARHIGHSIWNNLQSKISSFVMSQGLFGTGRKDRLMTNTRAGRKHPKCSAWPGDDSF